jgi:hypothetical protein
MRTIEWGAAVMVVTAMLAAPAGAVAATDTPPDLGMMRINKVYIDTTKIPGHRLLRYNSRIADAGTGPLEISASRPATTQKYMTAMQDVYQSDGTIRQIPTGVQVKYQGGEWRLQDLEAGWLEDASGQQVGQLAKHWYCPEDGMAYNLSLPGAPQSRVYTGCGSGQPSLLSVVFGVSVGWADVYSPASYQQWVDITSVPDGTYYLYAQADPDNYLLESNESNNETWTKISISGDTVTILKYGPHI